MSEILMDFWSNLFVLSENIELISLLNSLEVNASRNVIFILGQMRAQLSLFFWLANNKLNLLFVDRDIYLQKPFDCVSWIFNVTERKICLVLYS